MCFFNISRKENHPASVLSEQTLRVLRQIGPFKAKDEKLSD